MININTKKNIYSIAYVTEIWGQVDAVTYLAHPNFAGSCLPAFCSTCALSVFLPIFWSSSQASESSTSSLFLKEDFLIYPMSPSSPLSPYGYTPPCTLTLNQLWPDSYWTPHVENCLEPKADETQFLSSRRQGISTREIQLEKHKVIEDETKIVRTQKWFIAKPVA